MTKKTYFAFFLLLILFVSINFGQTSEGDDERIKKLERLFDEGNDLMEAEKFAEALAKYKELLAVEPKALGPLYNAGSAAFNLGEFRSAANFWKQVKAEDQEDMQVRAKLIQTYQNMESLLDRDTERTELFNLRFSGKGKGLANDDFYVREQSVMAGRRVMVFEHFELKTNRAIRYAFYFFGNDDEPEFRISLGSYDLTNSIWRETTKPTPKEGERLFHLDGYYDWGHATYGMYPKEPSYDEVRKIVIGILEKDKKPISSSTVISPSKKPDEEKKPQ